MDFASELVRQIAAGAAGQVGVSLYNFVVGYVREAMKAKKPAESRRVVQELGEMSPERVRAVAQGALPKGDKLSGPRREELVAILVNLARRARLVASHETAGSFAERASAAIDEMLDGVQPVRRPGEAVGPGREDWILIRFLGMGAFGEVWLARNRHNRNLVYAYKFFTSDDARQWLGREQQNLGHIRQRLRDESRVVRLFDLALSGQKHPFLVLEYVAGGSLEDWILGDRRRRPALRKGDVVHDIVRGLAAAHDQGIYHRDLKPGNILLTAPPDVRAKVTDFGLADIRSPDRAGAGNRPGRQSVYGSRGAAQVGTPMYWPPEAWLPFADRDPARDDVFAVGVIWYQLLVERLDRPPYDFADGLRAIGQDSYTVRTISQCLAGPERRFKDARALLDAIDHLPDGDWEPPDGSFGVGAIAREYLVSQPR